MNFHVPFPASVSDAKLVPSQKPATKLNELVDLDLRAGLQIIRQTLLDAGATYLNGDQRQFSTPFDIPLMFLPMIATHMHADMQQWIKQKIDEVPAGFFVGLYCVANGHHVPYLMRKTIDGMVAIRTIDPKQEGRFDKDKKAEQDFAPCIAGHWNVKDLKIKQQSTFNNTDCGFFALQTLLDITTDIVLGKNKIFIMRDDESASIDCDHFTFSCFKRGSSQKVRQLWDARLASILQVDVPGQLGFGYTEDYQYVHSKKLQMYGDQWRDLLSKKHHWFVTHSDIKKIVFAALNETGVPPRIGAHPALDTLLLRIIEQDSPLYEFIQEKDKQGAKFTAFKVYYQARINEIFVGDLYSLVDKKIDVAVTLSDDIDIDVKIRAQLQTANVEMQLMGSTSCEALLSANNHLNTYVKDKCARLRSQAKRQQTVPQIDEQTALTDLDSGLFFSGISKHEANRVAIKADLFRHFKWICAFLAEKIKKLDAYGAEYTAYAADSRFLDPSTQRDNYRAQAAAVSSRYLKADVYRYRALLSHLRHVPYSQAAQYRALLAALTLEIVADDEVQQFLTGKQKPLQLRKTAEAQDTYNTMSTAMKQKTSHWHVYMLIHLLDLRLDSSIMQDLPGSFGEPRFMQYQLILAPMIDEHCSVMQRYIDAAAHLESIPTHPHPFIPRQIPQPDSTPDMLRKATDYAAGTLWFKRQRVLPIVSSEMNPFYQPPTYGEYPEKGERNQAFDYAQVNIGSK